MVRGELPVTAAIHIAHEQRETETDRKLKAHQPAADFFLDLVTVDGELALRNYTKVPAELLIDLPLPGRPVTASDDGKVALDTARLKLQERSGNVSWRLTLKAGEAKVLKYAYERYVPSQ